MCMLWSGADPEEPPRGGGPELKKQGEGGDREEALAAHLIECWILV